MSNPFIFSLLLLLSPTLMAQPQLLEITPNTPRCEVLKALVGNNERLPADCKPCPEGQCKNYYANNPQPVQRVVLSNVSFANNSDQLSEIGKEILHSTAQRMKEVPDESFYIQGHANRTGSYPHNKRLSQRRAINTKKFLVQLGVDRNRLVAEGFSYDRPYTDDPTDGINRRVEFVNSRELDQ